MPTQLSTLAQEVQPETINALLLARAPGILDESDEQHDLYLEVLSGATDEVEAVVGVNPQPAPRRRLAIRAIGYATAADLEESLFPEQQQGDTARAAYLRRRYDELIRMLEEQDDTGIVPAHASPSGSFPAALPYPDPAMGPCSYPC